MESLSRGTKRSQLTGGQCFLETQKLSWEVLSETTIQGPWSISFQSKWTYGCGWMDGCLFIIATGTGMVAYGLYIYN